MVAQKAEAKKERGDGPMIVTYADKAGKVDLKRANTDVVGVVVVQREGNKSKSFNVSTLPANVKDALAAMAFAQRCKVNVANNSNDSGDNVVSLADAQWADLVNGKIYSRSAESKAPGRVFDPVKYADAMRMAYAAMAKKGRISAKTNKPIQPMSDKAYEDFKVKLMSLDGKERSGYLLKLKKDTFFAAALAKIEAANKEKAIDEDDAFDLF